MEQYRYRKMVETANCYYYGAKYLIAESNKYENDKRYDIVMKFTFPKITLASIACEIYLKALVYRKHDKLERNEHNLEKLFIQIDDDDKKWCEENFNRWIGDRSNFNTELTSIKKAYTQWRYIYEKGWTNNTSPGSIIPGSVSQFMELLKQISEKYIQK